MYRKKGRNNNSNPLSKPTITPKKESTRPSVYPNPSKCRKRDDYDNDEEDYHDENKLYPRDKALLKWLRLVVGALTPYSHSPFVFYHTACLFEWKRENDEKNVRDPPELKDAQGRGALYWLCDYYSRQRSVIQGPLFNVIVTVFDAMPEQHRSTVTFEQFISSTGSVGTCVYKAIMAMYSLQRVKQAGTSTLNNLSYHSTAVAIAIGGLRDEEMWSRAAISQT